MSHTEALHTFASHALRAFLIHLDEFDRSNLEFDDLLCL